MHIWMLKVMALVAAAADAHGDYGEICRALCSCEEADGVLTVGCEDRGILRLSEISPVRFSSSYHLLLTGNLLKKLSPDGFLDYGGVTILHLGNNDISELETGAFSGLQGLRRLHLNNNRIDVLREDTFSGLESLEYLQIDYNYITSIEPEALSKLRLLEVLILNDNLLSSLPANVFHLVPLTHLDLRGNRLKAFPYAGLLEHMGEVVELQLEENPWNCSCELIALKAWLESIAYTALVGEVVCETPFRLHGRDLDEVSKQELCPRRAISEYEMRPPVAWATASATSSAVLRSSSRPTKGPRPSGRSRFKPTSRVPPANPYNYGPIIAYQTKSPVPLDCPTACTCNLQISDLGLNVNCQERKIENISDLRPKPYNPKKMYLTGNYIPVVRRVDFLEATGLDLLHLGNNRIALIHDRAFGDLTNLRRLYLNGNLIDRLTADMFYGLQNLQYLYLEYNLIREVAPGAFRYAPHLQLLFLNNNLLKTLPGGVFAGMTLARLSLRSNHFRSLPVSGVLDQLRSLVQVDLHGNPWECGCETVGMRTWLEQLSAGTVVNEVVCSAPQRLSGEDVRSVRPDLLCPGYPDAATATADPPPPTEDPPPRPASQTPPRYDPSSGSVPLSVLILSLLLVFILSVFVAAGLFAVVVKRRKKSSLDRDSPNDSDLGSFNLQYALYSDRPVPKVKASAGTHVYEYVPRPLGHMCKNPIYRSREGDAVADYHDLHELKVTYRSTPEEEQSPVYSVSTIEARDEDRSPEREDVEMFFRSILEPEKQSRSPSGHGYGYEYAVGPAGYVYTPGFDVRRQFVRPEETMYRAGTGTLYAGPNRNEYLEVKGKLRLEPDYLEVLEKQTTFSQF